MKPLRLAVFLAGAVAIPSTALAQLPINITGLQVPITIAPPALQAEQPQPQPQGTRGGVWIAGHWEWNGSQYTWDPGHWRQPPQQGNVWEAARWVNDEGAWRYIPGHWHVAGGVTLPVERFLHILQPPPAPQPESPPPQPSALHVWITGHWAWNGSQYNWDPGYWRQAPRPGAQWYPGQWYSRESRWYYAPGHW